MAKIDLSKIPNIDKIPEDIKQALETYEFEVDYSGYVKKEVFDAKAREASEFSKKLKEKMTEEELKEADRKEKQELLEKELNELRKEKSISESKAQFLALGYDEKLATAKAQAWITGDFKKAAEIEAAHLENLKKAERASALAGVSVPPAGDGTKHQQITKEMFKNMKIEEIVKLKQEQPETFKQLTSE